MWEREGAWSVGSLKLATDDGNRRKGLKRSERRLEGLGLGGFDFLFDGFEGDAGHETSEVTSKAVLVFFYLSQFPDFQEPTGFQFSEFMLGYQAINNRPL